MTPSAASREGCLLLQLWQLSLQWPQQIFGILHPSRGFFCLCLFVFLVFYNLKQVKTKLLLVQHSQEPGASPAVDFSIFMYCEHYLEQELCSRLWNDELCQ